MTRDDLIQQMEGSLPSGARLDDDGSIAAWLVGAGYRARDVDTLLDDVIARARKLRAPRNAALDCAATLAALIAGVGEAAACPSDDSYTAAIAFDALSIFAVALGAMILCLTMIAGTLWVTRSPPNDADRQPPMSPPFP